jgi:hypothetical protein
MDRTTAIVALAAGVAGVGSALALGIFFAAGEPFGTINDFGGAIFAALAALLAWRLTGSAAITYLAIVGALIAIVGAALVISKTTGFFLAGLVTSAGWGLVGIWLVAFCWSQRSGGELSSWLVMVGLVAGALMLTGLAVIPGIAMRLDDFNAAPAWVYVGFVSWLGILVYLGWTIWVGVVLLKTPATA